MLQKTQIGFAAALTVLAISALIGNLSLHAYQQADRARDRTLEVVGAADSALQLALDAETTTRGFVITGDEAWLEPGRASSRLLPESREHLRNLTMGSARQQQRANLLGLLIEKKLAWAKRVAETRRNLGFDPARALVASGNGSELMNELRRVHGEMRMEELALLAQRDAAVNRKARLAELATVLGSVLALLLIGSATIINYREKASRRAAEDALRQAHGELETRVQERTAELTQANRVLRMIRECNQLLVRVEDEAKLLDEICRVIVRIGGYRLAWTGCAVHEKGKTVRARAGDDAGFIDLVHPTWADVERASCPCGRAVRTARSVVVLDVREDPGFAPWSDEALARGYTSVASLPLVADGVAFGVLTVYGGEAKAFDGEELTLLKELASDVAFGVRTLRLRAERDTMRAQLVQADRMAAIGTLAAGVAHDINNPLAYVIANLDYVVPEFGKLALDLPRRRLDEVLEALSEVRHGAERIRQVVGDLKTFSRFDEEQQGLVDVTNVLKSCVRMALNEIKHRAVLVKDFHPTPLVNANSGRLGQVFLNLIVNAAHAIQEGSIERNEIRLVTGTDSAGRAVVEVRDTGTGIAPENLGRIFEPFFTTKPLGTGTGLGLFICRDVVKGLGGELTVESKVGKGSVFRVALPAATSQAEVEKQEVVAIAAGRRGRVLVVDDELAIGRALHRLLAPEHDVVVLTSARQALERIIFGERFDVIFCDVMMPEMTGMALYEECARLAPDQARRMVLLTGGPFTAKGREFLQQVTNQRLEKPFDFENVRSVVRRFVN